MLQTLGKIGEGTDKDLNSVRPPMSPLSFPASPMVDNPLKT